MEIETVANKTSDTLFMKKNMNKIKGIGTRIFNISQYADLLSIYYCISHLLDLDSEAMELMLSIKARSLADPALNLSASPVSALLLA